MASHVMSFNVPSYVQTGPWKPNGRDTKSGLHFSGRDSAFTSPVLVTKPMTPVGTPVQTATKEVKPLESILYVHNKQTVCEGDASDFWGLIGKLR